MGYCGKENMLIKICLQSEKQGWIQDSPLGWCQSQSGAAYHLVNFRKKMRENENILGHGEIVRPLPPKVHQWLVKSYGSTGSSQLIWFDEFCFYSCDYKLKTAMYHFIQSE